MKKLAALFVVAALVYSCTSDNLEDLHPNPVACDTANVSFANTILPIMNLSCGTNDNGCHQTDNSSGGYGLANYAMVSACVTNSANDYGVVNTFVKCLTWEAGTGLPDMPKNAAKLDDCSINKIQAWINQGMQNN